ncbi:MAG: DUF177 domain-containing protein [Clostridia bacterium]|nr:DUF177 domain-containing protein [Clostridia bacterium]
MVLDLKSVFADEGKEIIIDYSLDMSDTDYAGGYPLKTPVSVKGRVRSHAGTVELILDMNYTYTAPCDRCGTETVRDYGVSFERMLATSIEGEESDTIIAVPDMMLDVDELVFTEVFLSLPRKHLCSETCKGYCLGCGKNLNEGDCECGKTDTDPRLSKLKELLDN